MDGPDHFGPLFALDRASSLTDQVAFVQNQQHAHPAGVSSFECFLCSKPAYLLFWPSFFAESSLACCHLTGDGKSMQSTNFLESKKCWVCDGDVSDCTAFEPSNYMPTHVRAGAFLGTIPPCRRVGDFVHAASRVANAILKRLGDVAKAKSRKLFASFKDYLQLVTWDAMQGTASAIVSFIMA